MRGMQQGYPPQMMQNNGTQQFPIQYNQMDYSGYQQSGIQQSTPQGIMPQARPPTGPTAQPLRNYLNNQVGNPSPASHSPQPIPNRNPSQPKPVFSDNPNIRVQDSTGLDFGFKDKIKDSTYPSTIQSGFQPANTATSRYVEPSRPSNSPTPAATVSRPPGHYSLLPDATDLHLGQSSVLAPLTQKTKHNLSTLSQKEQIEFGDHSERLNHLLGQNRELKELVIVKENSINSLKALNMKLEKELQNIMDPLSKNSQLKSVPFSHDRNTRKLSL